MNTWTLPEKKIYRTEGDGDTNCNRCTGNTPNRFDVDIWWLRNQGTNRDHPDYSIVKIGQNTEKSPRDLRTLVIT